MHALNSHLPPLFPTLFSSHHPHPTTRYSQPRPIRPIRHTHTHTHHSTHHHLHESSIHSRAATYLKEDPSSNGSTGVRPWRRSPPLPEEPPRLRPRVDRPPPREPLLPLLAPRALLPLLRPFPFALVDDGASEPPPDFADDADFVRLADAAAPRDDTSRRSPSSSSVSVPSPEASPPCPRCAPDPALRFAAADDPRPRFLLSTAVAPPPLRPALFAPFPAFFAEFFPAPLLPAPLLPAPFPALFPALLARAAAALRAATASAASAAAADALAAATLAAADAAVLAHVSACCDICPTGKLLEQIGHTLCVAHARCRRERPMWLASNAASDACVGFMVAFGFYLRWRALLVGGG